jgi:hypothetical protein
LKEKAKDSASQLKDQASHLKDQASNLKDKLEAKAGEVKSKVEGKAESASASASSGNDPKAVAAAKQALKDAYTPAGGMCISDLILQLEYWLAPRMIVQWRMRV